MNASTRSHREKTTGPACAPASAYELRGIKRFHGERQVLQVDELRIDEGICTGITGPNGSGKSTLLRLLAFLDEPDAGTVFFEGSPVSQSAELRRVVSLLPQDPYLLRRTVEENLTYGLKLRAAHSKQGMREQAAHALTLVGLEPGKFFKRQWYELSGGEAQRVALAARLALSPRVLLLDEPTAGLDEDGCRHVAETLRNVTRAGLTCIVVSHDREWLEPLSRVILQVRQGRVSYRA